jgi:hypothetical protein
MFAPSRGADGGGGRGYGSAASIAPWMPSGLPGSLPQPGTQLARMDIARITGLVGGSPDVSTKRASIFLSHARRVPAPAPTACSGGPDYNGLPQNSQYNSIAVFSLASSSGHPSLRQLSVIASITVCQNRSSFQMSNFIASSIPRAGGGARGGLAPRSTDSLYFRQSAGVAYLRRAFAIASLLSPALAAPHAARVTVTSARGFALSVRRSLTTRVTCESFMYAMPCKASPITFLTIPGVELARTAVDANR